MPKHRMPHDTVPTKNALTVVGHCPVSHKRQFASLEEADAEAKRLSDESGYRIRAYLYSCCPYYHVGKERCRRCDNYLPATREHICPNPALTTTLPPGISLSDLPAIDAEYEDLGRRMFDLNTDLTQLRKGILDPAIRAGQPLAVYRAAAAAEWDRLHDRRAVLKPIRHRLHQYRTYLERRTELERWATHPPEIPDPYDLILRVRQYFFLRAAAHDGLDSTEQAINEAASRWLSAHKSDRPPELDQ